MVECCAIFERFHPTTHKGNIVAYVTQGLGTGEVHINLNKYGIGAHREATEQVKTSCARLSTIDKKSISYDISTGTLSMKVNVAKYSKDTRPKIIESTHQQVIGIVEHKAEMLKKKAGAKAIS